MNKIILYCLYIGMPITVILTLLGINMLAINKFCKNFNTMQPIINGKLTKNPITNMIKLIGKYKNREVLASYQVGWGLYGLIGWRGVFATKGICLKVKPNKSLPNKLFCVDYPHPTKDTNLNGHWLEKYCPFKETTKYEDIIKNIDYLSDICKKIESEEIKV